MQNVDQIRESLYKSIHNGELSNGDMGEILIYLCNILNLKTLTDYAKSENISYNGAKKRKLNWVNISGVGFIIDNK